MIRSESSKLITVTWDGWGGEALRSLCHDVVWSGACTGNVEKVSYDLEEPRKGGWQMEFAGLEPTFELCLPCRLKLTWLHPH